MKYDDQVTLEKLVDAYGLSSVIRHLVQTCFDKADHILANYQDKGLAELWTTDGKRLSKVKILNGACRNARIVSDTGWIKGDK